MSYEGQNGFYPVVLCVFMKGNNSNTEQIQYKEDNILQIPF